MKSPIVLFLFFSLNSQAQEDLNEQAKPIVWKHYYVTSETICNIWNCKTNELFVLTKEVCKRMQADGKNKD